MEGINNKGIKTIRISYSLLSIIALLVLQIAGFAYGYGQLSSQVGFNRELIKSYQINQQSIIAKLDDQSGRITKLETRLEILINQGN